MRPIYKQTNKSAENTSRVASVTTDDMFQVILKVDFETPSISSPNIIKIASMISHNIKEINGRFMMSTFGNTNITKK